MKRSYLRVALLLVVLAGSMLSCNRYYTTSIGEILDNPREYDGKTVKIKGTVQDRFGVLLINVYTLADDTGTIHVVSTKGLPRKGSDIEVTGRVISAFSLGDQSLMVVRESDSY